MDKSIYIDENGYPGTRQADGSYDGGDTAAIMGTVFTLGSHEEVVELHSMFPWNNETPARHGDVTKWYGYGDRFSRDQLIPVVCCLVAGLSPFDTTCFYYAHKKRWFLTAWNTRGNGAIDMPKKFPDICGPEIWALWIRVFKPWWANPVLTFLDIETLVNTFMWRWYRKDNVCRNHMLVCLMAKEHSPTITSWLAYKFLNWDDLLDRWEHHCKVVGEYPTYDLFRETYLKMKKSENK